jgi:hypothetical protein
MTGHVFLAFAVRPNIVPRSMPQEPPPAVHQPLFEVAPLHAWASVHEFVSWSSMAGVLELDQMEAHADVFALEQIISTSNANGVKTCLNGVLTWWNGLLNTMHGVLTPFHGVSDMLNDL